MVNSIVKYTVTVYNDCFILLFFRRGGRLPRSRSPPVSSRRYPSTPVVTSHTLNRNASGGKYSTYVHIRWDDTGYRSIDASCQKYHDTTILQIEY